MKGFEVLHSPLETLNTASEVKQHLLELNSLPVFHSDTLDFCDRLGRAILQDRTVQHAPEVLALGFWLRRANLLKIRDEYQVTVPGTVVVPRGIVFHVAPSNVDTIFLYSWAVSVLCGNRNLVRISSRESWVSDYIIGKFAEVAASELRFSEISRRTIFCRFPHESEAIREFSSACDVRVIWGGDHTIATIRKNPVRARSTDIGFADRFSFGALKAASVNSLDGRSLETLVSKFVNDTYVFNQKACSSPRLIFWIGTPSETDGARSRFWPMVAKLAAARPGSNDPSNSMYKIKNAFDWAIRPMGIVRFYGPSLTVCSIEDAYFPESVGLRDLDYGAGSFVETTLLDLGEVLERLDKRDQTMAHFGFSDAELRLFAELTGGRGLDRIVPIGNALDFSAVWDGWNLLETLTARVAWKNQ